MKLTKLELIKRIILSETFLYLIVGGITTVLSWVVFIFVNELLKKNNLHLWILAEVSSFIIAVTFAFFCDKIIVFRHSFVSIMKTLKEFFEFVSARLVINFLAVIVMGVLIEKLKINEYISKGVASIVNIVLNYLVSKYIVFVKIKKNEE